MSNKVIKIQLAPVEKTGDILENILAVCNFCEKSSEIPLENYKNCLRLGHNRYYCSFCLKHGFTYKSKKDILLLDFKGIIGFYVYYLFEEKKIYFAQILNHIKKHDLIGRKNPVFYYDIETLTWYVDFRKVGNSVHKISITSVNKTISDIIDSFNLNNVTAVGVDKFKEKYFEATNEFYNKRKRPEGKRILSPTLKNCAFRANIDWEETKNIVIPAKYHSEITPVSKVSNFLGCWSEDLNERLVDTLTVHVKKKMFRGVSGWEGLIELPGVKTKLINKDGSSFFEKKIDLSNQARFTAKKLGLKTKFETFIKKPVEKIDTPQT